MVLDVNAQGNKADFRQVTDVYVNQERWVQYAVIALLILVVLGGYLYWRRRHNRHKRTIREHQMEMVRLHAAGMLPQTALAMGRGEPSSQEGGGHDRLFDGRLTH